MKKCPVCAWDIKDKGVEVKVGKKTVYACCADCAKKIQADPARYAGVSLGTAK
jgi:hypothetical protein